MDLIGPGIHSLHGFRGRSNGYRLFVRATNQNSITRHIFDHYSELNSFTNNFLANELAILVQQHSGTALQELVNVQEAFKELYYEFSVGDLKVKQLPSISVERLKLIHNLGGLEGSSEDGLVTSLRNFVNYYTLLVVNQKTADLLLFRNILLKTQLRYWQRIQNGGYSRKLVYFIQVLPLKFYGLLEVVFDDFIKLFNSDEHEEIRHFSVEEDHWLYHTYEKAKKNVVLFYRAFYRTSARLLRSVDPTAAFVSIKDKRRSVLGHFKKLLLVVYKTPSSVVTGEVSAKVAAIQRQLDQNYARLGFLINNLPEPELRADGFLNDSKTLNLGALEEILGIQKGSGNPSLRVNGLLGKLVEHEDAVFAPETAAPSVYVRYWPLALILLHTIPGASTTVYHRWDDIVAWVRLNLVDTVVGFWKNWVLEPLGNMVAILRHDEQAELSITSKELLALDLDSLERMVVDYVKDYEKELGPEIERAIHEAVKNGNMTALMLRYEEDLRTPVKALVKGSLVRSLLIQVQKAKVDGGVAVSGIDKLLKLQQLVFGMVSVAPSLLVLYQGWRWARNGGLRVKIDGQEAKTVCLKALNRVSQLVDGGGENDGQAGELLVAVVELTLVGQYVVPKELNSEWAADVSVLGDAGKVGEKQRAVERIWNMYGPYMR